MHGASPGSCFFRSMILPKLNLTPGKIRAMVPVFREGGSAEMQGVTSGMRMGAGGGKGWGGEAEMPRLLVLGLTRSGLKVCFSSRRAEVAEADRDLLSTHLSDKRVLVFSGGSDSKESACNAGDCLQYRKPRFDPWVRKIPWRRKWAPTPVLLAWRIPRTEEPGRLQSMGSQELDMT